MTSIEIKELCHSLGADLVRIASVDRFVNAPAGHHPKDVVPSAKSVIVLATILPKNTLEQDIEAYTKNHNKAVYKMDKVAQNIAAELKKHKYKATAIISLGGKWIDGRFRSRISLKHSAELAGLGVIVRNYLLTNDKYGNLLWFTAVVTSLELDPSPLADYEVCNDCNLCVENCPSGALTREDDFAQKSCHRVCYVTVKGVLELHCWQCRSICPYKYGANSE